jgi:hypothetical protein
VGRSTLEYNLTKLRISRAYISLLCRPEDTHQRDPRGNVARSENPVFLRYREEFFGDALRAELINSIVKNCALESRTSGDGR